MEGWDEKRNPFQELGLKSGATDKEIKKVEVTDSRTKTIGLIASACDDIDQIVRHTEQLVNPIAISGMEEASP